MGVLSRALKAGIGWPNVGWQPPSGYTGRSITDIVVNADTAMTVGAFHAGVRLIAEDIASLPLNVLVHVPGGGSAKALNHPSYTCLHDVANPDMTAMVWLETMVGHYLSWGNCYSEKELNGQGQTVRLWPLRPDRMTVRRDLDERVYEYRLPDGSLVVLPQARVLHVPGFGFDGLVGYSRIAMWRRAFENAIAIEEYGLHTFATGVQPTMIIRHPQQLGSEAKKNIRTSWDEGHVGLSNTQRAAILDEGMSVEAIGFDPEDAQFVEAKKLTIGDMARALRLAPHKLSDMSEAHFNNIEESNIDHVIGTLVPILVRFEQQFNKDVLGVLGAFYAKFNVAQKLRGSAKERAEFYQIMRQIGILTDEDIRALEDLNPLTAVDRQHILWPLNSVPASAYDDNGMTMQNRVDAVGVLVRVGYDPAGALLAMNLSPIAHSGLVPVTVTLDPLAKAVDLNGKELVLDG